MPREDDNRQNGIYNRNVHVYLIGCPYKAYILNILNSTLLYYFSKLVNWNNLIKSNYASFKDEIINDVIVSFYNENITMYDTINSYWKELYKMVSYCILK